MRITVTGPQGRELSIDDERLTPFRDALGEVAQEPARMAFAATHVVLRESYADLEHSLEDPGPADEIAAFIDWKTTLAVRERLDSLGFGIAEAMDTAQRFFLGWDAAARLIDECGALDLRHGFIAGAGVDHLPEVSSKASLIDGVLYQVEHICSAGGWPILLPLLWLPRNGCDESDYVEVYEAIIREAEGPLFVHWLGDMFLPELRGYFPGDSFSRILALDPPKVRGAKLSLLDDPLELRVRRELLERDQIVLTGDDLHFARLILGGDTTGSPRAAKVERRARIGDRSIPLGDFSHALFGVLNGIAEPASVAFGFLSMGDTSRYLELMEPCEALGHWLFREPTRHYKAGLAFLAWLNGLQNNFLLVNREDRARDLDHYWRAAELAARAGALCDASLAAERLEAFMRLAP